MKSAVILTAGALALAGCVGDGSPRGFDRAFTGCMFETGAPGTYTAATAQTGANGLPLILADEAGGGTAEGAAALNACVERRVLGTGAAPTTASGSETTTTTRTFELSGGTQTVTQTNTSAPAATGSVPLPTEYTLLPGDRELWPTLTSAQQQRAILFLESGSTIRSSLQGD